jgi:K(+)-stimulated pyrophosphate-energized sodium pump
MQPTLLWPGVAGVLALLFVVFLVLDVLKRPRGNDLMIEISDAVQVGAKAFLKREYFYISIFVVVIFVAISAAPSLVKKEDIANSLGWQTGVSFVIGAIASALAGFIGMGIATRANSRTTEAARKGVEDDKNPESGLKNALSVAISGGAVMGMSVVGIGLLGLVLVISLWGWDRSGWINGYAMGASLVALFARSGGGIFTKGADMGADLVGKVEAGIPEDDPRNAATIADNVGDNVGDVAGLGADLMESYIESMIAAIALAWVLGHMTFQGGAINSPEVVGHLQFLPLMLAAVGIVSSIIGISVVKFLPGKKVQSSLMNGTYVAAVLAILGTIAATYLLFSNETVRFVTITIRDNALHQAIKEVQAFGLVVASISGIAAGAVVGFMSEYYTSSKFKPVQGMARKSMMGPAITITDGLAVGMKSCAIPVIVLAVAMLAAFHFAHYYGIALAAFGMLATTGMIVAVDSYGPIADNAGGCAEMAHLDKGVRAITDNLDAVGNTTAAIGKGFAIGSAAFAALCLLVAYMVSAGIDIADMSYPKVMFGLIVGGMFPFYFSALLFDAVSKAAFKMIDEVRRQLREIPGIMEGKAKPDYARCVAISTDGAIKGMLLPGALAIAIPPVVGFVFGKEALAGLLIGALVTGVMLGIMNANAGGAMDNAKKFIEEGKITNDKGEVQGKGSDAHKAAVIGDTVGDPLKDTVGPSINILIKLMAVISLVIAPLLR